MKTRTLPMTALISLAALTAACSEEPEQTAEITVEINDWNGWDQNHQSTATTETHTVAEGETFEFSSEHDRTVIAVVESVEADSVVFTLDTPIAPRSETGISMRDTITEITVTEGEVTMLATPTEDAGLLFDVTVEITP